MIPSVVTLFFLVSLNLQRVENLEWTMAELNSTYQGVTRPMYAVKDETQFGKPTTVEVTTPRQATFNPAAEDTKSMTFPGQIQVETTTDGGVLCPVRHGSKCFFPVIGEGVSYSGGKEICDSYGGHLANIYNQTHMDDVMNYIREHRWREKLPGMMYFRLGMKFDPLNGTLSLRDGSDASDDLRWWPGYPFRGERYSSYTTMILDVNEAPRSYLQFLVNSPAEGSHYDVLCEIGTSKETATGGAASLAEKTTIYYSTKSMTSQPGSKNTTAGNPCPVQYEGRCFFAVFEREVNRSEGREICERFGGNLANIYSQSHMGAVLRYFRREFDITVFFAHIHLGMTFDPQTRKIYFRDGSEAPPGLRWYPGAPFGDDTSMVLGVNFNPLSRYQYLENEPPNSLLYILCETGTSEETATVGAASLAETTTNRNTTKSTTSQPASKNITAGILCPVRHGSKCFFPVIGEKASYNEGMEICDSYGGHLANIYSKTHMNDVMNYIRKHRWRRTSNWMYFRLGMMFDPLNGKLSLRDGSEAADDLQWWDGYPDRGAAYASYTTLLLDVNKDRMSDWQFLVNIPPEWSHYDVLCEIETSEETATGGAASLAKTTTIHNTTKSMMSQSSSKNITADSPCPVRYEGRCFFSVFERKVNLSEGREICESFGGNLANIYSQTHMDDVIYYIRRDFYIWVSEDIRLGMTFDPQAKKIYLRDGSEAPPSLRWYPGAPFDDDTSMIVRVGWHPSSQNQYLDNQPPESLYYTLCETGGRKIIRKAGAGTMAIEENSGPADDTTKSMTSQPISMSITSGVLCLMRHGSKCFFPVFGEKTSYNGGMEICDRYGGHLANIYSQTHMNDVMNYIRQYRWWTSFNSMHFRLGMKFDPLNVKLSLRDGSEAADDLQWAHGYPRRGESFSSYTTLLLDVNKDRMTFWQFLVNVPPEWSHYDVLCEIETSEETDTGGAKSMVETTIINDTTAPIRRFPVTMAIEESPGPADNPTKSMTSQPVSISTTTGGKIPVETTADSRVLCPVRRGNKCFFPVIGSGLRAWGYNGGMEICESYGGHLANIYSQTHMNDVMNYIREHGWRGTSTLMKRFRLGMKFDPLNGKLSLRDGSDASDDLRWFVYYPRRGALFTSHTTTILDVNKERRSGWQFLLNIPPEWSNYDVLCETETSEETDTRGAKSMVAPTAPSAPIRRIPVTMTIEDNSGPADDTAKSMTSQPTSLNITARDSCPVRYEGRCFFAVFERRVNLNEGREICEQSGGNLANIYSQTHMDDVMNYIRKEFDISIRGFESVRLGMTFDPQAGKLFFRDGSQAPPRLRWYLGEPFDSTTSMVVVVRLDSSTDHQYLDNGSPGSLFYILCETGTSEETDTAGAASLAETATIPDTTASIRRFPTTMAIEESSSPADDTKKSMTPRPASMHITTGDPCPVRYEDRCFFSVFERKVNRSEGRKICERFGGNLANIYSQTHMDDVIRYIRRELDILYIVNIHLGMTFDPQTRKIYFRDGSEAPRGLRWYPASPYDFDTSMVLVVNNIPSSLSQYLDNEPPNWLLYILCETGERVQRTHFGPTDHEATTPMLTATKSEQTASRSSEDITSSVTSPRNAASTAIKDFCPIRYERKCFLPIFGDFGNYTEGITICESYGGQLANIYSQTHMEDIMNYIREDRRGMRNDNGNPFYSVHLGMVFDPVDEKLRLRDGSNAPDDLKWRPSYPRGCFGEGCPQYTAVILGISGDESDRSQYLFNSSPQSSLYDDVLCEIE